jgi:hypothetical protein
LAKASDPVVPAAELGSRNIAELIVQLIVSQSDAIIGKAGRKYVPFYGTFFFFILLSNLLGLLPGFGAPTANLNTTIGLSLCSFIGYNVIGDFDVTRKDITFFDKAGNAISVDIFVHYVGTLTNSVTGKSLDDKGNVKNTINLVNGTFTETGGFRHTTIRGLGIVIQETGRIVVDDASGGILFVTPGMSVDEAVQLCAALQ